MTRVKIDGWGMICWQGSVTRSLTNMVGGTKNHRLSVGRDMIERASETSSRAREYLPGLSAWGLDVEKMVLMTDGASDVWTYVETLKAGTAMSICLQIGLEYYEGDAIIEKVDISAPFRGKATARMTLRGTGALTKVDVENWGFTYTLPMAFDLALAEGSESTKTDVNVTAECYKVCQNYLIFQHAVMCNV